MKRVKVTPRKRDAQTEKLNYLVNFGDIAVGGYTRLIDCPEIDAGICWIADIVSSMTLQVMQNRRSGDVRVRDGLAQFLDITPWSQGTRHGWIYWIVKQLVAEGNAVCMIRTRDGILTDLTPMPRARFQSEHSGIDYTVQWKGYEFDPDTVLHFALNPDPDLPWLGTGVSVTLRDVADSLKQASATKAAFMTSDYKPPIVVSVNALADGYDTPDGRKKLLREYVEGMDAGQPWVIPGEIMKVESVRPLSLTDIAIKDGIELDRRSAAAVLGIPAYALGVGSFNKDEYNNAVRTRIRSICACIEQTITKSLIVAEDRYVRFNSRSLFAYDLKETAEIFEGLRVRGLATGNEVRDAIGLSPKEGLDDLVILENYIPAGMIGQQKKLIQEGKTNADEN